MTDSISKEKRSYIMSMIKGKNTKPEIIVRKYLFHCGFRFRVNVKRLPGTPDIVLRKYKTVIFVNGCFWHGHEGCPEFRPPRSRVEWWTEKLRRNKERDARVREELKAMGWNTMVCGNGLSCTLCLELFVAGRGRGNIESCRGERGALFGEITNVICFYGQWFFPEKIVHLFPRKE